MHDGFQAAEEETRRGGKGIEGLLARDGLGYVSLLELGNPFFNADWEKRYSRWSNAPGDLATERLLDLPDPLCLLCCESKVEECHRAILGNLLAQRGHEIHHIDTRAVLTEQALRRRRSSRQEALAE